VTSHDSGLYILFALSSPRWRPLATLRRIRVEEEEMTKVLGEPYRDYQTRTRRLIPGVW
jgi:protein-S-isoprenylcysteine O-methyltransferase Ste14